ncbi:MAG: hypothetical protein JW908_00240 [Anaerolineales bacterium]|nr:hypothetical protein [Anaerolineales bacterium]
MIQLKASYMELMGSSYEIGNKLGQIINNNLPQKALQTSGGKHFKADDMSHARTLFDRWCPGLNEEIQGFADALGFDPAQATYYSMTYLIPRCSQIALLPGLSENGHVLLARNYEFSHQFEDFILTRTGVEGKYIHLSTSVMQFGRDEGLNECGLAVSMSSCGFPVGGLELMRKPALRGLQFWAVIRTLLENCKDVGEAISFVRDIPIAYNINLLLADRSGSAALVETLDGKMAIKQIDKTAEPQYLHATNHVHLPELKQYEPMVMRHSKQRYEFISQYLNRATPLTIDDLKTLLLGKFPHGLCCHYYDEFFGTTKSIIMDLDDGKIECCWGGLASNGWKKLDISQPLDNHTKSIEIMQEVSQPGIFDLIPE